MKNQELDKDTIVELIGDNRLQEALQALEKLTRGTHLHNQVVVLSSSYAEYSQLNRNAAQDFQTLEMQRTRISNSLLSFLDELSPDDYQKHISMPIVQTPIQSTGVNYKWLFIGGGGVLALIILIAVFSGSDSGSTNTSAMVPAQTEQTIQEQSNDNQTQITPTAGVSAASLKLVEFGKNSQILGVYRQIDAQNWVERSYSNDSSFKFKEVNRDESSVYLHDPSRNIDIELNLETHTVLYSDKNRKDVEIYKIINAQ